MIIELSIIQSARIRFIRQIRERTDHAKVHRYAVTMHPKNSNKSINPTRIFLKSINNKSFPLIILPMNIDNSGMDAQKTILVEAFIGKFFIKK